MLERIDRVVVGGGGIRVVGDDTRGAVGLGAGDWAGVRNRFWAMLVRSDHCATALEPRPREAVGLIRRTAASDALSLYASTPGRSRRARSPAPIRSLERLLFSGLWSWLRPLSFALLWLLRRLTLVIGHPGVAIIALAVSVKILLLPLTLVADRLQEQVNAAHARLQPGIDAIKAAYRGEERTRRTVALYREHGVHPLYALKSLVGFLIQLPVFVAVFDMLAEDFDLHRVSFLWIRDLSRPDMLFPLPFCIPFFGCDLNALPFLMSGVSLATVLRFRSVIAHGGARPPATPEPDRGHRLVLPALLHVSRRHGAVLDFDERLPASPPRRRRGDGAGRDCGAAGPAPGVAAVRIHSVYINGRALPKCLGVPALLVGREGVEPSTR